MAQLNFQHRLSNYKLSSYRHKSIFYNHSCPHYYNIFYYFYGILANRIWFLKYTLLFCQKIIFAGSHLGFFRIRNIGMTQCLYKWFHSILWPKKHGVDTKNMILCKLELETLSTLDFRCGNFEKWPKPTSRPIFPLVTSLISFTGVP